MTREKDVGLGTVNGRPATQADEDAIMANADAGFPGVQSRRMGRPTLGVDATRPRGTAGLLRLPDDVTVNLAAVEAALLED